MNVSPRQDIPPQDAHAEESQKPSLTRRLVPRKGTAMHLVLIVAFGVLSLVPAIGLFSSKIGGATDGVENGISFPALSLQGLFSETFQKGVDQWWGRRFALRSTLIRSDNQLSFSLFKERPRGTSQNLILGKNNYLYEMAYINAYNRSTVPDPQPYLGAVKNLVELQDRLAKRDITLMVMISPSKASFYPQFIPEKLLRPGAGTRPDYQLFIDQAKSSGLNLFNAHEFLKTLQQQSPYPIFTKGGTHWSAYAACNATSHLLLALERASGRNLKNLLCDPVTTRTKAWGQDADLAKLLNLWDTSAFSETIAYPRSHTSKRLPDEERPAVLFVGTSFMWLPLFYLHKHEIFSRTNLLYYFKSNFSLPSRKKTPIDPHTLDWQRELLNRRYVILEVNESSVKSVGYGFTQAALKFLRTSP